MEEQKNGKQKAFYELVLPKSRHNEEKYKIELKELDEATFTIAYSLASKGEDIKATKLVLSALYVGGDAIDEVLNCFPAVQAARGAVMELVTPLDYELKKK